MLYLKKEEKTHALLEKEKILSDFVVIFYLLLNELWLGKSKEKNGKKSFMLKFPFFLFLFLRWCRLFVKQ